MASTIKKEMHSHSYHQYGEDCSGNRSTSSRTCIYSGIGPQSYKLPSNYYHGMYPLTVELPEAFPSINLNMLPESPRLSGNINDMIQDTSLSNKPSENNISINQDLPQSAQQFGEGEINNNQELNSNIYLAPKSEFVMSHQCKKDSDIKQEKHLYSRDPSGKNFISNPNVNTSSPLNDSISNEHLNSLSTGCKPNGTDLSTPIEVQRLESYPDIIIIKDLHQSFSISVKTEGLYSPKKLVRKTFRSSGDFNPLTHQTSKIEVCETQQSDPKIQQLSPNGSNVLQITESSTNQMQNNKLNKSIDPVTLTKKISANDSRSIQIEDLHKTTPNKIRGLNISRHIKSEDLYELLHHLSKSDVDGHQGLNPEYSKDVNIFIVGLVGCETIRLIHTLAQISQKEIRNLFGLAFEKNFKMPGVSLTIKCWHLRASSKRLRTFCESSRNVMVLVYDETGKINMHAIRKEIEFLKLANLPILLVGNTSDLINNPPKPDCPEFRDLPNSKVWRLKYILELSSFLECSIESIMDVHRLLLTAIYLAFRHRM